MKKSDMYFIFNNLNKLNSSFLVSVQGEEFMLMSSDKTVYGYSDANLDTRHVDGIIEADDMEYITLAMSEKAKNSEELTLKVENERLVLYKDTEQLYSAKLSPTPDDMYLEQGYIYMRVENSKTMLNKLKYVNQATDYKGFENIPYNYLDKNYFYTINAFEMVFSKMKTSTEFNQVLKIEAEPFKSFLSLIPSGAKKDIVLEVNDDGCLKISISGLTYVFSSTQLIDENLLSVEDFIDNLKDEEYIVTLAAKQVGKMLGNLDASKKDKKAFAILTVNQDNDSFIDLNTSFIKSGETVYESTKVPGTSSKMDGHCEIFVYYLRSLAVKSDTDKVRIKVFDDAFWLSDETGELNSISMKPKNVYN